MQQFNIAEAKAELSALIADVEKDGEPVVIARRGRPVVALIPFDDLARLQSEATPREPGGVLALAGAWSNILSDEEIDEMIDDIYEQRQQDFGRQVELPE